MGIILDIIVIAIMALSIFLGYKKGLIKLAVSLFALLIAIVVTLLFYKPVSNAIIENTEWDEKIESVIIENASKKIEEENQEDDGNVLENLQQYVDNTVAETQNEIVESAAQEISVRVINIIAIIGLFLATRLLLILLVLISNIITELPIIKQFNELGGVLYGVIRGLAIIYIILAILYFIVSLSANTNIANLIDSSLVTKFMYSNNILLNIIF